VSKQFTAFAIGLLAQDGKLSWDDDIRKYLPELPDYGHKVTLAQMLHHTAGMREEFHLMYLAGWRYDDPRTEADALRIGHDGADAGYRSDVVAFPDQRLVIVALCNSATATPSTLTRRSPMCIWAIGWRPRLLW
jgi:CubicO group peptidase (beta-lactamase class C family)